AAGFQPAPGDVESNVRARVADMAQVVDRDAADVHAHMAGLDRRERLEPARECVVDVQGHRRRRAARCRPPPTATPSAVPDGSGAPQARSDATGSPVPLRYNARQYIDAHRAL